MLNCRNPGIHKKSQTLKVKVVFLIIYFWEVKTISQDKSMNLDGSLDDDDDDGKKVELLLLSLCVMV